jgi:hypothetical protein
MNCDQCQLILEEFVDGELDTQVGYTIDLHLQTCAACSLELQRVRTEAGVFASARIDLEATQALWLGVKARIVAEPRPAASLLGGYLPSWWTGMFSAPRFSVPATIALVLLAVLTTVVFMKRTSPLHKTNREVSSASPMEAPKHEEGMTRPVAEGANELRPGPTDESKQRRTLQTARHVQRLEENTPDKLVREAQQKYVAAIQLLSRDVDRKRSSLAPDTRLRLEEALSSIDRTIAATKRAVRRSPEDPIAVQYMLAAYAKKVDVLREMVIGGSF